MGKRDVVRKIQMIPVESIADIARITASSISMNQPAYIVRIKMGSNKVILGSMAVFRDYYSLYGVPMLYYYECRDDECKSSKYVSFKLDEMGEHVKLTNNNIPGTIMVPIINIEKPPEFIVGEESEEREDRV